MTKYIKQVFDRLSRGGFIASDSSETKHVFVDVEDNYDEYKTYFEQIGFNLEQGNGYFYFSRKEQKVLLEEKLNKFAHWVDVLDFLKAWEPAFGPGFTFNKAQLTVKIDSNIDLKDKSKSLYERKDNYEDIVERLTDELLRQGFIELIDAESGYFKVLNSYLYVEQIVNLITIDESDEKSE